MSARALASAAARGAAVTLGVAGLAYAVNAGVTFLRYGCPPPPRPDQDDPLLDRFMPRYDVVERMRMRVRAPAEVTLAAAERQDLMNASGIRGIFRLRQFAMGAGLEDKALPRGLVDQVKALGWIELARVPGREVVLGAVTQPWLGDVVFRAIQPAQFAAFGEPAYVKIAWTLRADPTSSGSCFLTETRAVATDLEARRRFRPYWSLVAPGVWLIRRLSRAPMRRLAELDARRAARG